MHISGADIINVINYIINHWQTIGAYSLGGVSLATIAHKVERGRGNLSLQKLGYIIVALGSVIGVLAQFALHAHASAANWHVLPANLGFLSSVSLFAHKFLVSDSFEAVASKLSSFSRDVKALEAVEQQLQAQSPAAVSADAVPADNQFVG